MKTNYNKHDKARNILSKIESIDLTRASIKKFLATEDPKKAKTLMAGYRQNQRDRLLTLSIRRKELIQDYERITKNIVSKL